MAKDINELWKDIEEFPNYEIFNFAQIRNKTTKYILKNSIGHRGYYVVILKKDGKAYLKTVHRLLAIAFIPNPDNKTEINHIDGNKFNYSIENLEWVTPQENNLHARRTGLHLSDGDKITYQYDLNNNLIATYKSGKEASRITGIPNTNISAVTLGKRKNSRRFYLEI